MTQEKKDLFVPLAQVVQNPLRQVNLPSQEHERGAWGASARQVGADEIVGSNLHLFPLARQSLEPEQRGFTSELQIF